MSGKVKAIRGMPVVSGAAIASWRYLENAIERVISQYGCHEIRLPLLEYASLFMHSAGETSDIVNKEMYTFPDRHDDLLALRPEGTAGCIRAAIEQGYAGDIPTRLAYTGPMFRYERPQKGRSRQFHQFGMEWLGHEQGRIDAELIASSWHLLRGLGLENRVKLEINSLADIDTRNRYISTLREHFQPHTNQMDELHQRRLETNPLRILDSKSEALQPIIQSAPTLLEFMDDDAKLAFDQYCEHLSEHNIPYHINPRLVRGLDYYNGPVFEWITDELGAQGTVCAGGRYDSLTESLGGSHTPALGYAFGLERLAELLTDDRVIKNFPLASVMVTDENHMPYAVQLLEQLRHEVQGIGLLFSGMAGPLKKGLKHANRDHASYAIIIGDNEASTQTVTIKALQTGEQHCLPLNEVATYFKGILS